MNTVTVADLNRRREATLEKAQALVQASEAEDRDLNENEQNLEAELWAEAESLKARAERLEKIETAIADNKKPGKRVSAPVTTPGANLGPMTVKQQLAAKLGKKYAGIPENAPEDEETIV